MQAVCRMQKRGEIGHHEAMDGKEIDGLVARKSAGSPYLPGEGCGSRMGFPPHPCSNQDGIGIPSYISRVPGKDGLLGNRFSLRILLRAVEFGGKLLFHDRRDIVFRHVRRSVQVGCRFGEVPGEIGFP